MPPKKVKTNENATLNEEKIKKSKVKTTDLPIVEISNNTVTEPVKTKKTRVKKSEPVTSEPATSEPATSEPVTSETVTSKSVKSKSVKSKSVKSEPVKSEPVKQKSSRKSKVVEKVSEPVVEPAPEPVVEPVAEKVVEKVVEKVAETVVETIAEKGTELLAEADKVPEILNDEKFKILKNEWVCIVEKITEYQKITQQLETDRDNLVKKMELFLASKDKKTFGENIFENHTNLNINIKYEMSENDSEENDTPIIKTVKKEKGGIKFSKKKIVHESDSDDSE